MSEFFLELFSEEIPAGLQKKARIDLLTNFNEFFKKKNIKFSKQDSFSTPNRLLILFIGIQNEIHQKEEEIRGPKIDAPEKALIGFLKSNKLLKQNIYKKQTEKGSFYFAKKVAKKVRVFELLNKNIPQILDKISWKKSMKWGNYDLYWARHLKSIMAIFDKKLRSIANTIKDNYIKKYVLEYFLEKISELTPHTTHNKKNYFVKKTRSLESTKKHFNESQSLTGVEFKEFSLLYLIINNLNLIQENIHFVENVKLFTDVNNQIFDRIVSNLKSGQELTIDRLGIDSQLIDKINKFAPIKHILKKKSGDDQEIIELLKDITRDLKDYDLEFRIQELESKFSKDLSETTFNELQKELKKKQNIN